MPSLIFAVFIGPPCPRKHLTDAKILFGRQLICAGPVDFADHVDRLGQSLLNVDDVAAADDDVEREVAFFEQLPQVDLDHLIVALGGAALNHRLVDGVWLQAARHRENVDDLQLQRDLVLSRLVHRSKNVDSLRAVLFDEHRHLRVLDHLAVEEHGESLFKFRGCQSGRRDRIEQRELDDPGGADSQRVPEIVDAEDADFNQISRSEPVLGVGFP